MNAEATVSDQNNTPTLDTSPESKSIWRKILKEESSLSLLKMIVTALTAVSMALISTQLTSILNSLALVAFVSIGTAIISEFYRIIISVTSLGAKKVIAPIVTIPLEGSTLTEVTEIKPAVEQAIRDQEEAKRNQSKFDKISESVKKYFRKNPTMKMVLIFLLVSVFTVSANYFVVRTAEVVQSVTNYTTVQSPVQEITEEEKQRIIDDAVSTSQYSLEGRQAAIEDKLDSLITENYDLKSSVESFKESAAAQQVKIAELEKQVQEITKTEPVESPAVPAPQPSPSPSETTPTPTPSPTIAPANIPESDLPKSQLKNIQ